MQSASLAGKRVLVTHADAFMGPVLCEVFREQGATVIASALPLLAPDEPAKLLAEAGHVDVLVANLAIRAPSTAAVEVGEAEWREVFAALYLDTRHRALGFEELFRGSIDGAEVHPRALVERALAHGAAAVIVGHNHPSGNPEPSAADRAVTQRLKQALALVDVRLLDHFVVGDGAPVSMAARGLV